MGGKSNLHMRWGRKSKGPVYISSKHATETSKSVCFSAVNELKKYLVYDNYDSKTVLDCMSYRPLRICLFNNKYKVKTTTVFKMQV